MLEYYKILWLKQDASMEEVIASYTRLAMKNNPTNWGTHYLFNIIHYAYNEIINNYNNKWLNKDYLLLKEFEIKSNNTQVDDIIEGEIDEDNFNNQYNGKFLPKPSDICNEVYNIFKYYDTNPFIKDDKYNLSNIITKFNNLQLEKKENKQMLNIKSSDLFVKKNIFKKVDILSKVWPAIDLALYICDLYNYDVDNNEARWKIRMLLITESAKDIIAKNWWMILNENKI